MVEGLDAGQWVFAQVGMEAGSLLVVRAAL